jgi:threonine aldolase
MSFGATKNGAMALEAVIFFDEGPCGRFRLPAHAGRPASVQGQILGAQMLAYLDGDLWLDNARHANAMAQRLAKGVAASAPVRLPLPTQANEVFAIIGQDLHARLTETGVVYHQWPGDGPGTDRVGPGEVLVRFVTSYVTAPEDVDRLADLMSCNADA